MDGFLLRLRETGVEDGELTFAGLSRLTSALQLLALRVGRGFVGQDGPGRSAAVVQRATELRLRPPRQGSTVLDIAVGEPGVLGDGLENRTVDHLFLLFDGAASDTVPSGTSPVLGSAVVEALDALGEVSGRCELSSSGRRAIDLKPRTASRSVWPTDKQSSAVRPDVTVVGRLDRVDLRNARFRMRDAVGNDIALNDVSDTESAGRLVGQTVTASGTATVDDRGQIVVVTGARIGVFEHPDWSAPELNFDEVSIPPYGGIPGITEADVEDFLESLRE